MYTLHVCLPPPPLDTGRELGVQTGLSEVLQGVLETFYIRSDCELCHG